MNKARQESLNVRLVSVGFSVLTLGLFKPFGLDAWATDIYLHLMIICGMGVVCCMLTELILKYVVRMPLSAERGVSYIIRRNLWFQLINTPLISVVICMYRHFVLSERVPQNHLSWSNYLETLLIIAFCSFTIGLYWRFKFRTRYLAYELEETKLLNEQLKAAHVVAQQMSMAEQSAQCVELTGTTSERVRLMVKDFLYAETVGNYVKVYHQKDGQVRTDMLRATSRQLEEQLQPYPMIVRCHRAFIVNLNQVERITSTGGNMQLIIKNCHDCIPVSRSNVMQIKRAIHGE